MSTSSRSPWPPTSAPRMLVSSGPDHQATDAAEALAWGLTNDAARQRRQLGAIASAAVGAAGRACDWLLGPWHPAVDPRPAVRKAATQHRAAGAWPLPALPTLPAAAGARAPRPRLSLLEAEVACTVHALVRTRTEALAVAFLLWPGPDTPPTIRPPVVHQATQLARDVVEFDAALRRYHGARQFLFNPAWVAILEAAPPAVAVQLLTQLTATSGRALGLAAGSRHGGILDQLLQRVGADWWARFDAAALSPLLESPYAPLRVAAATVGVANLGRPAGAPTPDAVSDPVQGPAVAPPVRSRQP